MHFSKDHLGTESDRNRTRALKSQLFLALSVVTLLRNLPFSRERQGAWPTLVAEDATAIGATRPGVEPGIVYAIARQESGFNPRAISSAGAVGLYRGRVERGSALEGE